MGATGTRDRMVRAATALFRERGYDGTGFRDVAGSAGTTPGVIYHHFPHGKSELGVSVATSLGDRIARRVEDVCAAEAPATAVSVLADMIEQNLVAGDLRPGCPIAAVTLAAEDDDGRLRASGDAFFRRVRTALALCLERGGIEPRAAESFAALAVAACEGAVILCRASGAVEPLTSVRGALLEHLALLTAAE